MRDDLKKERADVLVFMQGLADSREKAQALILSGNVCVGDKKIEKPGQKCSISTIFRLKGNPDTYVSRGAYKLLGAIEEFKINLKNKICLDIGASTGGFTQVCLEKGASKVYAVDVGHSQLHWKIKSDTRVKSFEKINMREPHKELFKDQLDFICVDTSFISLKLIFPTINELLRSGGECVVLIKPQFEVKKEEVEKGGIVKNPYLHDRVKKEIAEFAQSIGMIVDGLIKSPIEGTTGNIEFLMYCHKV